MTRKEILDKARAVKIANLNSRFWERFWNRVDKTGDCWNWMGSLNLSGYGQVKLLRKAKMCHRITFEVTFGPIPEGMQVCHRCDNPRCVRPEHLFLGTPKNNVDDCISKNRRRYKHGSVPKRKGEFNGRAKLIESVVDELRKRTWNYGDKAKEARRLGISASTINWVLSGRTWSHI